MKVVGICVDLSRLATAVNGDGLGFASEVLSSVPAERCHVTILARQSPKHHYKKVMLHSVTIVYTDGDG